MMDGLPTRGSFPSRRARIHSGARMKRRCLLRNMQDGPKASVALQLSGHLRSLCDSRAHFAPLADVVRACRAAASTCDLFVHTWDELHAQTSSWHTWYPTDNPARGESSRRCVAQIREELRPAAVRVERQSPSPLSNETWIVVAGRHRETHVSLGGLRSAIRGVAAAAAMRREFEREGARPRRRYDLAIRLRPDLYHRRNVRKGSRANYRGQPVNQICSVPPRAWATIAGAAAAARGGSGGGCDTCVRACDDDTIPGNKSGDMCFWSSPPSALDRLVASWDRLADEYLQSNLCWQRWRAEQQQQQQQQQRNPYGGAMRFVRARGGATIPVYDAANAAPVAAAPPCAHPETQWEGSAAELILAAAAERERIRREPLRSAQGSVRKSARCT